MDVWLEYLRTYEPYSQLLLNAGFPEMSKRLTEMRKDIEGARAVYDGLYQNAVNFQAKIEQINEETRQAWFRAIQEVNDRRRAVFEETQEMRSRLLR